MKRFKIIGMGVALMGLLPIAVALAAAITISPNLPGPLNTTPTGSSPGAYIKNFYSYALFLSGLLAFGAIVYGGIKYAIARGNPSGESEAKQWIWSALLGMLLLAGAYIILFTINPNLVNLALPTLPTPDNAQNNTPPLTAAQEQQIKNIQQQPCNGICPGQCQPDNTCKTIIINPHPTLP
jgi:formate hydrogenlyase subunit 3/multisubunit Na+/H+ antiporter MnhD subunit